MLPRSFVSNCNFIRQRIRHSIMLSVGVFLNKWDATSASKKTLCAERYRSWPTQDESRSRSRIELYPLSKVTRTVVAASEMHNYSERSTTVHQRSFCIIMAKRRYQMKYYPEILATKRAVGTVKGDLTHFATLTL